jgi:hypothetical protein
MVDGCNERAVVSRLGGHALCIDHGKTSMQNRTPVVQNLLTIWELLDDGQRYIVHSDAREGMLFTYHAKTGELALWTLTLNSKQGAGWWKRAARDAPKGLTFHQARARAAAWHVEWVQP